MANTREGRHPAPLADWRGLAAALNARMTDRRIGQQELADRAGVSVATLRILQHGGGERRVQNATLAAVSRALGWPADYLLSVLLRRPLPDAEDDPPGSTAPDMFAAIVDGQAEILAVLRRIETHVEGIARSLTPA